MTHAESRARRMRVLAYRNEHPTATDEEIALALGWTRRQVYAARRAAGISAGRSYQSTDVVVNVLRSGPASLRAISRATGLTIPAADYHVRKLRREGRVVGERAGNRTRWRLT